MTLPPEDAVIALTTNAQRAYSEAMKNLARLNLVHLAISAKAIDENARYVVLDDSDQTVGDYVIIGLDADGDELRDNGDDFQMIPMNLCEANESTWIGFLNRDLGGEYGEAPYYLDIDKVIEEYPTWQIPDEHVQPAHDCGICDSPIRFVRREGPYATFVCISPSCDWWHIAKDCCHETTKAGLPPSDSTCRHCSRTIVNVNGIWVDPDATGDDSVWRETCDAHDTFQAEHEPVDV